MPLTPTWIALPGELQQLLLELTRRVVGEEKPLEFFHWKCVKPRYSRYNGAILKKLVVFLKTVKVFCLQLGRRKVEERFRFVGNFAKLGGSCGVRGTGYGFRGTGRQWLANRRSPHKGYCRPLHVTSDCVLPKIVSPIRIDPLSVNCR